MRDVTVFAQRLLTLSMKKKKGGTGNRQHEWSNSGANDDCAPQFRP